MKLLPQYSEPEHVKDRQAYRLRIEGKHGQAIEIVEQMGGGFSITGVSSLGCNLVIEPIAINSIIVTAKP